MKAASRVASSTQGSFDFEASVEEEISETVAVTASENQFSARQQAQQTAEDYRLQMQAYALALRELLPAEVAVRSLRATLHFLDPNIEISLPVELLTRETCAQAVDDAMQTIAELDGTLDAESFPPLPASHCRMCNFLELCGAGRDWLRQSHTR